MHLKGQDGLTFQRYDSNILSGFQIQIKRIAFYRTGGEELLDDEVDKEDMCLFSGNFGATIGSFGCVEGGSDVFCAEEVLMGCCLGGLNQS